MNTAAHRPTDSVVATRRSRKELALTAIVAISGLLSVGSLLAWSYRLGRFDYWFLALGAPAILTLFAVGILVGRSGRHPRLRTAMIVGVVGGLVGTIGYDFFRVPFAALGLRLFSPIESYGVMILGADSSSPWTDLAGWGYHFSNGIGFGVFYAAVALGRKWWWGLLWAMVLETATILTPFATTYAIAGKWDLIAIAYAAHVAYGVPLGLIVQSGPRFAESFLELGPHAVTWTLVVLVVGLLAWHRPWSVSGPIRNGAHLAEGPSALVVDGRFQPEWVRVAPGGCASFRNEDSTSYDVEKVRLEPGRLRRVCFEFPGVHRVRTSSRPYSGGFVIVDPALAR